MSRNSAIVLAATVAIGAVTGLSTSASARSYHPKATAHHVVRSHFARPTVTRSHTAYAVRPVYRQIRSRPAAFHSGVQTVRLGSTKYRPIPGLGDKVTAKAKTPSATDLKIPVPGGTKVQPLPGQKPVNVGDKFKLKTTPAGTTTPSAPTAPASPAKPTGPSTTTGPTNSPSAMHAPGGRGPRWTSQPAAVAAATSTTESTGAATSECGGLTADGGYLTWRRVFNAKGEAQLLCVKVFE